MTGKSTNLFPFNASILLNGHKNITTTTNGFADCTLDYSKVAGSFGLAMNLGVIG
ncbi:Uncharacterised protein [Serratia marcescens]|nr:Uncharacterised protein [Serratia marcescens]